MAYITIVARCSWVLLCYPQSLFFHGSREREDNMVEARAAVNQEHWLILTTLNLGLFALLQKLYYCFNQKKSKNLTIFHLSVQDLPFETPPFH